MRILLFGLVKLVLLELGPVEESDLDLGPGNNNMWGDTLWRPVQLDMG